MQETICYITEASKRAGVEPHVLRYWEDELKLSISRNEMGHRCYTGKDIETLRRIKALKEQGLQLRAIRAVLTGEGDAFSLHEAKPAEAESREKQDVTAQADGARPDMQRRTAQADGARPDMQKRAAQADGAQPDMQRRTAQADGATPDMQGRAAQTEAVQGERAKSPDGQAGAAHVKKDLIEEKVEDMVMKKAKKYMVTMSKGKETVLEMPAEEELREYEEPTDDEKEQKARRLQYLLQHMVTDAVKSANKEMCTDIKESILKELDYQFRQQEERDAERLKRDEEHYRRIDEMICKRRQPREKFSRSKKKEQ